MTPDQARDWPATAEARLERIEGPHEWGYRDLTDGTFVADDAPYNLAQDHHKALSYIAELETALEPFRAEAARWPAGLKDRHEPFPISPLKLGDFRRAAAALQKGADHA